MLIAIPRARMDISREMNNETKELIFIPQMIEYESYIKLQIAIKDVEKLK